MPRLPPIRGAVAGQLQAPGRAAGTSAINPTPDVNSVKGDIADGMSVIEGKAEVAAAGIDDG